MTDRNPIPTVETQEDKAIEGVVVGPHSSEVARKNLTTSPARVDDLSVRSNAVKRDAENLTTKFEINSEMSATTMMEATGQVEDLGLDAKSKYLECTISVRGNAYEISRSTEGILNIPQALFAEIENKGCSKPIATIDEEKETSTSVIVGPQALKLMLRLGGKKYANLIWRKFMLAFQNNSVLKQIMNCISLLIYTIQEGVKFLNNGVTWV